ncbi:hypothetical protein MK534_09010, partial [Streptococcus gallolyticus subsp. gallolyticus]|jgi:hypothetical protein
VTLA